MVQLNFDANQVAPNAGFEPVPEGWYRVAITESEMKPTKDGEGAMLVLKASIIDGPHANKPIFVRLNLQNKNQQAVDIAYGELSSICHVTGVYKVADSSQLHGIPFQIKVAVRKGTDDKGNAFESNDVKGYKDAAGNEPGKAGANAGGNAGGGQPGTWGGNPQGQGTPAQGQAQGNPAFGGGAPQGNPQGQGQGNPQGQGQGGGNWQGQPQGNPNQGQPQVQGGGWQGGNTGPTQGQQQPPQNNQGGWAQQGQGGNPNGGAPWGGNGQ